MASIDLLESPLSHSISQPVTLDEIDIKAELTRRPYRPPEYEAENRALVLLAEEMAKRPHNILQKLVEVAHELCRADTAGISLLELHHGEALFRWVAVAGTYVGYRDHTMPRNASPCGTTLDRNSTQLMYMAERMFLALKAVPPVVEALLIPFHREGKPIGTVWVVAHDERRKFDMEDERVVKTLAKFASAVWQVWLARAAAEAAKAQLQEKVGDLERFYDIVVGRKLKLIALEKENLALREDLRRLKETVWSKLPNLEESIRHIGIIARH